MAENTALRSIKRWIWKDAEGKDQNGQYMTGFVEYQEDGKAVWNVNLPYRTLRWQGDGIWNEIMICGDNIRVYDKEELISYAEWI